MPPLGVRPRLASRPTVAVFLLELVAWGVWTQAFARRPFPAVGPVLDAGVGVGRAAFGCGSLGCLPYAVVGLAVCFYAVAVVAGTVYERGRSRAVARRADA